MADNSAAWAFFLDLGSGLERRVDFEYYPESTFFFKNGVMVFEYNFVRRLLVFESEKDYEQLAAFYRLQKNYWAVSKFIKSRIRDLSGQGRLTIGVRSKSF